MSFLDNSMKNKEIVLLATILSLISSILVTMIAINDLQNQLNSDNTTAFTGSNINTAF